MGNLRAVGMAGSLAVAIALAGCGPASEQAAVAEVARPVEVVAVKTEPLALTSELPGRVEPMRVAEVRARVPGIVMQMVRSLAWTWRNIAAHGGDPSRITVVGHSAGGHLTAMMMACLWQQVGADLPRQLVRNGLSISGLHDLTPFLSAPFLKDTLALTPAQVRQASPALLPAPAGGQLTAVVGGEESSEFHRQARWIQSAWGRRRVPLVESLPGLNHFTVLESLVQPGSRLNQLAWSLLRA